MKLQYVLADARSDAAVLRRRGHAAEAASLVRLCDAVEDATRGWLTMLSEVDAALYSGESVRTLQRRFLALERRRLAERRGRGRYYCQAVLTRRADAQPTPTERVLT